MSGDYSRYDFDPSSDYQGVLLQQGRPLTDEDWNELVAQSFRLAQASALDTYGGAAVVPTTTPNAFALAWSGASLTIGRGRIYVDGLLAENHGKEPDAWDPALAELVGTNPMPYEKQPYLPNPPALPTNGRHLVYIDVWKREVNQYEAPDIVEKALGVDTTTRIQLVWQVKVLQIAGDAGNTLTCSSDPSTIPGWNDLIAPSAGRLSTHTAQYGTADPCIIPPAGGYTGLENQLYRVEIHDAGAPGTATFKWSRDNASVEARVMSFTNSTSFVVDSIGKDANLGFNPGDWIELTDNTLELNNLPGLMLKIKTGGVDAATRTITVETAIDASKFPVGTPATDRRTRIRRWDQKGKVLRTDTNPPSQYVDLDTSSGVVPVPTGKDVAIALENGITVTFDIAAAGGKFRSGDYWMFTARAADASVEPLDDAPPRGIHHHYAKLGFIAPPDTVTDCRQFWPPAAGTESCACTVCVSPQAHAQGSPSLQQAIDAAIKQGGGTVCLEAGEYTLRQPLLIDSAGAITLRGQHEATQLVAEMGTAVIATGSQDVRLESFVVQSVGQASADVAGGAACIILDNDRQVSISGLSISVRTDETGREAAFAAIACVGTLGDVRVFDNGLATPVGIMSAQLRDTATDTGAPAPTANRVEQLMRVGAGAAAFQALAIERNRFACPAVSVNLQLTGELGTVLRIHQNWMRGSLERAIFITGRGVSTAEADITSNVIDRCGIGIWVAVCPTITVNVCGNTITNGGNDNTEQQGIFVAEVKALTLADNTLDKVALQTTHQRQMTAVMVQQCTQVRILRNTLVDIGPATPTADQIAKAIHIDQSAGTIDIGDNLVRQSTVTTPVTGFRWYGLTINDQSWSNAETAPVATTAPVAVTPPVAARALAAATATAAPTATTAAAATTPALEAGVNVHSNRFDAIDDVAIIATIAMVQTCHYCNNASRIARLGGKRADGMGDVNIEAAALIVCNNSIIGSSRSAVLGQANLTALATVLGNVASGDILLNGAPLPAPWAPLNVKV